MLAVSLAPRAGLGAGHAQPTSAGCTHARTEVSYVLLGLPGSASPQGLGQGLSPWELSVLRGVAGPPHHPHSSPWRPRMPGPHHTHP